MSYKEELPKIISGYRLLRLELDEKSERMKCSDDYEFDEKYFFNLDRLKQNEEYEKMCEELKNIDNNK